jgi:hypothetical protein
MRMTNFSGKHACTRITNLQKKGHEIIRLALKRKIDCNFVFELIKRGKNEVDINGMFHVKGFPHLIEATRDYYPLTASPIKS